MLGFAYDNDSNVSRAYPFRGMRWAGEFYASPATSIFQVKCERHHPWLQIAVPGSATVRVNSGKDQKSTQRSCAMAFGSVNDCGGNISREYQNIPIFQQLARKQLDCSQLTHLLNALPFVACSRYPQTPWSDFSRVPVDCN